MKIKNVNKKLASILMAGVILCTASGCGKKDVKVSDDIDDEIIEDVVEIPEVEEETTIVEEESKVIELHSFAYVLYDTPIYDNENTMNEIDYIDQYQKVFVISSKDNLSLVRYSTSNEEENKTGYIYSDNLELLPSLFVEVDISDQELNLYKDNESILCSSVVTGKTSTPTNLGYFDIDWMTTDTYLKGADYCTHVDYWMPFDGGIGLHDAPWRDSFGGDIYIDNGSHGCVNLDYNTASTIYDYVEPGSRVLVHK